MPQTFNNVREFVINSLKQYHALHVQAEEQSINTILADYPTSAEWDSTNSEIIFKHDNNVLSSFTINGANFVRDGMIDSVSIENYTGNDIETYGTSYLYINFNTDAESTNHVDVKIPLKDIFDSNNYYTKSEIDQSEEVTAAAILDLNTRVSALENGNIDLDDYVSKSYLSTTLEDYASKSYLSTTLEDYASKSYLSTTLEDYADKAYTYSAYTYLVDKIIEDEEVTATSITYIHSYISDLSELTTTELNSIFL